MSWVGAAITAAGSLLGAAGNQYSSSKAYRRSVNSAQHAHQWEVGDLKAAGLNPILSANNGASAQSFQAAPMDVDLSGGATAEAQRDLLEAQQEQARAAAKKDIAAADNYNWNSAEAIARMDKIQQDIRESQSRTSLNDYQSLGFAANALDAIRRSGTYGSVIQHHLAGAQQARATAFKEYQAGNITKKEFDYWTKNPDEYSAHLNRIPGKYLTLPLMLKNVFNPDSSASKLPSIQFPSHYEGDY